MCVCVHPALEVEGVDNTVFQTQCVKPDTTLFSRHHLSLPLASWLNLSIQAGFFPKDQEQADVMFIFNSNLALKR